MKLYKPNSEMAKQMNTFFGLTNIRENLMMLEKEDRQEKLNMIISTLVIGCTDTPEEGIGTLRTIQLGLMNILKK